MKARIKSDIQANQLHYVVLCIILTIAIAVRVLYLAQPMRHDESVTFLEFASTNLSNIMSSYDQPNNHILHSILVHFVYSLFGNQPWILRLPAFIAGVLLVLAAYLVTRAFYNRFAALLAAGLSAVSLSLIEYAANARGYSLIALIFLAELALARHLKTRNSLSRWLLFSLLGALGFYTTPLMLFGFGMICLWLALSIVQENAGEARSGLLRALSRSLILTFVLTLILYLPVILSSGVGVLVGHDAVMPPTSVQDMPQTLAQVALFAVRGYPLALIFGVLIGVLIAFVSHRQISTDQVSLLIPAVLWIVPLLLFQQGSVADRAWLFLTPVWFMLAAAGLAQLVSNNRAVLYSAALLLVVAVGGNLVGTGAVLASDQTGNVPAAEEMALGLQAIRQPQDVVLLPPPHDAPVKYYLDYHGYTHDFIRTPEDIARGFNIASITGRVYVWGIEPGSATALIDAFALDYAPFDLQLDALQVSAQPPLQEIVLNALPSGVLFADEFNNDVSEGWIFHGVTAEIVTDGGSSVLEARTADDWGELLLIGGETWTDYSLEIEVKVVQRTNQPLEDFYTNIRHVPGQGNYIGTINTRDNSANISSELGGAWSGYLTEADFPLAENVWYWLNMRAQGSTLQFYVNNEMVGMFRDSALSAGTIRIVIPPNTLLRIDDVVVREL